MFIAQVDEVDTYSQDGQQKEDINCLVQYLANAFHIKHKPLRDNDDDNARYFHASKFDDYNFSKLGVVKKEFFVEPQGKFPPYLEELTSSVSLDMQGPPPKS